MTTSTSPARLPGRELSVRALTSLPSGQRCARGVPRTNGCRLRTMHDDVRRALGIMLVSIKPGGPGRPLSGLSVWDEWYGSPCLAVTRRLEPRLAGPACCGSQLDEETQRLSRAPFKGAPPGPLSFGERSGLYRLWFDLRGGDRCHDLALLEMRAASSPLTVLARSPPCDSVPRAVGRLRSQGGTQDARSLAAPSTRAQPDTPAGAKSLPRRGNGRVRLESWTPASQAGNPPDTWTVPVP